MDTLLTKTVRRSSHLLALPASIAMMAVTALPATAQSPAPKVIELTQVGCQFLESENGVNRGFTPASAADCERINAETADQRLAEATVLELSPGPYVFRVTNKDVPYPLGFWVRDSDYELGNPLHKLTKTSVSGGGLETGETKDYEVDLTPGEYVYSCPLNPTPDYRIVVKG